MYVKNDELKKILGVERFNDFFLIKELMKLLKKKESELSKRRILEKKLPKAKQTLNEDEWALMNTLREEKLNLKQIYLLEDGTYGYCFSGRIEFENEWINAELILLYNHKQDSLKAISPFKIEEYRVKKVIKNIIFE